VHNVELELNKVGARGTSRIYCLGYMEKKLQFRPETLSCSQVR